MVYFNVINMYRHLHRWDLQNHITILEYTVPGPRFEEGTYWIRNRASYRYTVMCSGSMSSFVGTRLPWRHPSNAQGTWRSPHDKDEDTGKAAGKRVTGAVSRPAPSRTRLVRSPAAGLHHHRTTFLTNHPPAREIKEREGDEETGHLLPIHIWWTNSLSFV